MANELEKYSVNWILTVVAPGCLIMLFILWGFSIYYPESPALLLKHEFFSVTIFLLLSFITGTMADSICQQIEQKRYLSENSHPRLEIIKKNPHWITDLDEFYFKFLNIHIYDWNKELNKPKTGDYNGYKISKYNLAQFEHYAVYILSEKSNFSKLESEKSKYLLCRNLAYTFRLCGLIGIIYLVFSVLPEEGTALAENIFLNKKFCIIISATLIFVSFYLSYAYKKFRMNYITYLYRNIRFHYLTNIKPKQNESEQQAPCPV